MFSAVKSAGKLGQAAMRGKQAYDQYGPAAKQAAMRGKQVYDQYGPAANNLGQAAMGNRAALAEFAPVAGLGRKAATAPLKAYENIPRWIMRGLQVILGIVIAGIYGREVAAQRKAGDSLPPEFLFGTSVAAISVITAILFAVIAPLSTFSNRFRTYRMFWWDLILLVAWIAVTVVFGMIFLKRADNDSFEGSDTKIQKIVVYVDAVNAVLWLASGVYGAFKTCVSKKAERLEGRVMNGVTGGGFGSNNDMEQQYPDEQQYGEQQYDEPQYPPQQYGGGRYPKSEFEP